jgi:FAD/FMN-containing dehydrogenase
MTGRPSLIARCVGVADVQAALTIAREHGMEISVRGGGHSVGGWSSNDGGLVIDLSLMRWVRIDPQARTAWVGGGAQAGDILVEAEPHGLVVSAGAGQSIGFPGLAMGLGEAYLTQKYGYACDNLLAFDLVTADGKLRRVSAEEHPDLFWAMRGAGPNFGIVTALKVRLHPLPEQAVGGRITFDGTKGLERLTRQVWQMLEHGSEHQWTQVAYTANASGAIEVHALPGHTGPPDLAEQEMAALCEAGTVIADDRTHTSYLGLVWELEDLGTSAWEIARFPFGEDQVRQMAGLLKLVRSTDPELALAPGRGIILWRSPHIQPADPPSVAPRLSGLTVLVIAAWDEGDPVRDAREATWVARIAGALRASGTVAEAGNTVNHASVPDQERARRLFGAEGYAKLARLKAEYDPENVFRRNFNIVPIG